MKLKILFFLFFISGSLLAQVPGYLGKRFMLGYSNYFMTAFKGPGPESASPSDEASFTINNVHCLNFEYAVNQHNMICFSGQYLRTGIAYDRGIHTGFFNLSSSRDYPYLNTYKYGGNFEIPALLTSKNIGVGLKTFKRGFIAPTGKYNKFEVIFMFEKVKYDYQNFLKQDFNNSSNKDIRSALGTGEYSYKNLSFAYTVGNQRILYDKIVLDYGVRFAYTPAYNIIIVVANRQFVGIEDYYRQASQIRIFREQLINFHIGIGFLAF